MEKMVQGFRVEENKKKRIEMYDRAYKAVDHLNQTYHPVTSESLARIGDFTPEEMNTLHMQVFLEQFADILPGLLSNNTEEPSIIGIKIEILEEGIKLENRENRRLKIVAVTITIQIIWWKILCSIMAAIDMVFHSHQESRK